MFARTSTRLLRPLPSSLRAYSTSPPTPTSKTPLITFIIGTTALGAAGYFYYNQTTPSLVKEAKKELGPVFEEGKGWVGLRVESVRDVSPTSKILRLGFEGEEQESGLRVASALLSKFKPEGAEKPVLRPYTPITSANQKGYLDLLVKKYPNGPMSTHIHTLQPGDILELKGPLPKFPYEANKHHTITMIAGGTGITPMYQVIRHIFEDAADTTSVNLVYGNVSEEEILLKEELDHLANTYPRRFKVFYLLDKPPKDAGWAQKGFVTKEILKQVLPEPGAKGDNKIFVCGPPGLYKAVSGGKKSPKDQGELTGYLKELGYKPEDVYKF